MVNQIDLDTFVASLLNSVTLDACRHQVADINGDGALDGLDIDLFVDCILLGGCPN
jgi:hypothetical protein